MKADDVGQPEGNAFTRLQSLADRVEGQFGPGIVDRDHNGSGGFSLEPEEGCCPAYVMSWGDQLIFGVGSGGCRWELATAQEDLDFIDAVLQAVTAGRVSEVFGPGRSQVTVDLLDGTTAQTSQGDAPIGCLPVPFWTRRKRRRTQYLHY